MSDSMYVRCRRSDGVMGWAKKVPFQYTVRIPTGATAVGGSVVGEIRIDPGLPFICYEMGMADTADTTTLGTLQPWGVSLVDGNSQQLFSSGEAPRERFFGTRDFPRQLPDEVTFEPATTLTVTLTWRGAAPVAAGQFVSPVFTGYKLVGFTTTRPVE